MSSKRIGSCRAPGNQGIFPEHKRRIFRHFTGMVPLDRVRQDWVYEYAETERPLAARTLQGSHGYIGREIPLFPVARIPRNCRWSNGPAGGSSNGPLQRQKSAVGDLGAGGHKLSAIGSPQPATRSACFHRHPHWFAAPGQGLKMQAAPRAPSGLSAHPFLCPPPRSHPTLPHVPAAVSCRTERYDGKGNLYLQHAA
jgi:hypothetical protein